MRDTIPSRSNSASSPRRRSNCEAERSTISTSAHPISGSRKPIWKSRDSVASAPIRDTRRPAPLR